jgi:hypothetical protein
VSTYSTPPFVGWIRLFAHPAQQVNIYANKSPSFSLRGFVANTFQLSSMSKNYAPFRRHRPSAERVSLYFAAMNAKIQRHGSAFFGAGVIGSQAPDLKTPNPSQAA